MCVCVCVCGGGGGVNDIALHYCIKDSGQYNFMGEQITLRSELNPDIWELYLQDYWDKQLPLLVRFGFSLDYDREGVLESQEDKTSKTLT